MRFVRCGFLVSPQNLCPSASSLLVESLISKQCDVPGIAVRSLLLLGGRLSEIPVI